MDRRQGHPRRIKAIRYEVIMISAIFFPLLFVAQDSELSIDERFKVEYVLLDVAAFNKNSGVVTDLTKEDFEVFENGERMTIDLFDTLDLRVRRDGPPVAVEPGTAPIQQIIIAIDLESAEPLQKQKVFFQLEQFLGDIAQRPGLNVELYSLETGSITKGFVQNAEEARSALRRYQDRIMDRERGGVSGKGRGGFTSGPIGGMLPPPPNDMEDLEEAFQSCERLYGSAEAVGCISATMQQFYEEHEMRSKRVIGQLESLAYNFQDVEGLKVIYFISPGFTMFPPSAANELAQIHITKLSGGQERGFPHLRPMGFRMEDEFDRVIHACIKNRVVFYTYDIFNNLNNATMMEARDLINVFRRYASDVGEGLTELADESGGQFYRVQDFTGIMATNMNVNSFYYVIGYQSPEGKPGKFRKIKVKCKRRKVKLHYRSGYVGAI